MSKHNIILPSKPKIIQEDRIKGLYEIDGLYPGYGHTLGNSLRRVILSSMPGCSVTSIKIEGVPHEFSTLEHVKEDIITILLHIKRIRFAMTTDQPERVTISVKGLKEVTAADIKAPGQIQVINLDQHIATLTDKSAAFIAELTVEKGLGYIPKEVLKKDKVEIGTIVLDAVFTPIRRVSYEVDNMRVGDRTDYNRLRIFIETDGSITPHDALENSIMIMIHQLKSIVGFKEAEDEISILPEAHEHESTPLIQADKSEKQEDIFKTRIEDLDLSSRTMNALTQASIRTIGGLARKKEADLEEIDGLGEKGVEEIKRALLKYNMSLREA